MAYSPCGGQDAGNLCPSDDVDVALGQRRYSYLRTHLVDACYLDRCRSVIRTGGVRVEARWLHRDADRVEMEFRNHIGAVDRGVDAQARAHINLAAESQRCSAGCGAPAPAPPGAACSRASTGCNN